jgi:hypothetical protein
MSTKRRAFQKQLNPNRTTSPQTSTSTYARRATTWNPRRPYLADAIAIAKQLADTNASLVKQLEIARINIPAPIPTPNATTTTTNMAHQSPNYQQGFPTVIDSIYQKTHPTAPCLRQKPPCMACPIISSRQKLPMENRIFRSTTKHYGTWD